MAFDSIWKGRLLPPSFRGIPFKVKEHRLRGGRQNVQHEPIERDDTFSEDLGIKGKVFTIRGHVIGDAYFFIRDGLIKALDDPSPGILIHPYLGAKEVRPVDYEVIEKTEEGRIAYFTMQFVLAGQPSFPLSVIDAVTDFFTSAFVLVAQIQNAFQLAFTVAELPGYVALQAVSMLQDTVDTISNGIDNFTIIPEQKAAFKKKSKELKDSAALLVNNPATLAAEMQGYIFSMKDLVDDPPEPNTIDISSGQDDKLDIFELATGIQTGADELPEITPTNVSTKKSLQALQALINQLGIVALAEQSVAKDFVTKSGAVEQREKVADLMETQALTEDIDDSLFQGFEDLRSKLMSAIPNVNANLRSVETKAVFDEVSSLVLAYDLYEDADKELDIIRRNRVRNPGFIVGNVEVLSGDS